MIKINRVAGAYTPGASYGNNFINGDEALFEDASLQRDSFGFQIRPGIQSGKNDWRTANSGIAMAQFVAKSYRTVKTDSISNTIYTSHFGEEQVLGEWASKNLGNPYCKVNGNDIEITKGGTYIIQCFAAFVMPEYFTYSDSRQTYGCGYTLALLQKNNKGGYDYLSLTSGKQSQIPPNVDYLSYTHVGWFGKGDKLNVGFQANGSNPSGVRYDFSCQSSINLYRLS